MPTDTQIPGPETQAAPASYTVPSSVELLLKAVNANFTDNGAGGDWLPAVVLLSDSGHIIARAVDQGVKVTAGNDAEVSWFPGVKHAGGTSVAFQWCHVILGPSTPSSIVSAPLTGTAMPINSFGTSDPANYTQISATRWSVPTVPQVVLGWMLVDGGGQTTLNGDVYCVGINFGGFAVGSFGANGTDILLDTFGAILTTGGSLSPTWRAFAAGADTHQFDMHFWFGAVY